jgi:CheY-like chemotaxis protein
MTGTAFERQRIRSVIEREMSNRPPPHIVFIHNGAPAEDHIQYFIDAGLRVSRAHAETALVDVARLQPDLIILDFACDGDLTRQLKADPATAYIPVIALVELSQRH